jgi:hypothetical protein
VDDRAATAIQQAAQVVESATDVEIGDIHMPVLMGQQRLNEPCSLEKVSGSTSGVSLLLKEHARNWKG